jgi:aminoglycoside phosphotransferase (APT) family kinase protein
MALSNKTDPQTAERQLTAWLQAKLPATPDLAVINAVVPPDAGLSTETILFDAVWREGGDRRTRSLVARVEPTGDAVFPSYDLAAEYRVIRTLGEHTSVPVPDVLWHEPDASVLGAPFLVMERLPGRVPSDDPPFTAAGWVLELSPEQRATMYDDSLRVLAEIHAVDWRALELGFLGQDGLAGHIAYWQETYEWAAPGGGNPTIEAAFEWVLAERPTEPEPLVLNWGDARPGNILYTDELSISGVLDWEMVSLGSPGLELGWWLFLLRHHTEGIGAPLPDGFPSREQTIARYEELSGNPVANVNFYEVFAALRLAILMHRAGDLMISAGLLPEDAPMKLNNPATQLLARLTGLPEPTGTAQSFIGNR